MLRLSAALVSAALLFAGEPRIRMDNYGWIASDCAAPGAFSVYVDSLEDSPAIAGTYRTDGGDVRFTPRYPPSPGVTYRAECSRPGEPAVVAKFEIPKPDQTRTTLVEQVYPTSDKLPENLLKFYVHFSAPMGFGEAYRHVRLLDGNGAEVELPFLEIDEELWDAGYRRLTLLFDPGRIKSGLVPNREVGVALHAGGSYTLQIDAGWTDAEGVGLKQPFEKKFSVVEADGEPLNPDDWTVSAPGGGMEPVVVDFGEPVDHALLSRVVGVTTVSGKPVRGSAEISRGETRWSFVPDEPWKPGDYRVEAMTILEDLAGNSIGRAFEVDVFEKVEDRATRKTVSIPFAVGGN